jgi:hypothetical protein
MHASTKRSTELQHWKQMCGAGKFRKGTVLAHLTKECRVSYVIIKTSGAAGMGSNQSAARRRWNYQGPPEDKVNSQTKIQDYPGRQTRMHEKE